MVHRLAARMGLRLTIMATIALPRPAVTDRRPVVAETLLLGVGAAVDLAFWGGGTTLRWTGEVPGALVVGSTVAVFLLARGRSRHWVAAYAASWVHAVGWGLVLPTYESFTALMLCTYHVVRWKSARTASWFVLLLAVPWAVHTWNGAAGTRTSPAGVAGIAAVWAVITAGVWAAARTARRTAELGRLREESYAVRARLAVQEERLMLAREIHDSVAHAVSAITVQAAGAGVVARSGDRRVAEALTAIESTSGEAVRELRRLLGFLHQPGDGGGSPHLPDGDWLGRLGAAVETTRACGVTVHLRQEGTPRTPSPEVGHVAHRVVQESLTNVVKHRGPGSTADVVLAWHPDELVVAVASHGGGGPAPGATWSEASGHGLAGLEARVHAVGGRLEARARSAAAYRVEARLPSSTPAG